MPKQLKSRTFLQIGHLFKRWRIFNWILCSTAPPSGQFQCQNGACLHASVRCTGRAECFDGSDEWGCPDDTRVQCHGGGDDFQCDNGVCLNPQAKCDNIQQCEDGSDEGDWCPLPTGPGCVFVNTEILCCLLVSASVTRIIVIVKNKGRVIKQLNQERSRLSEHYYNYIRNSIYIH